MRVKHRAKNLALDVAEAIGIITRSDPDTIGDYSAQVMPPARQPFLEDALSLDAVYRAVTILQTATAQLSIKVRRGRELIDSPSWITQPDPWRGSGSQFFGQTTVHLAIKGRAYWKISRDPQDRITALTLLNPNEVTYQDQGNIPVCFWRGKAYNRRDLMPLALIRTPDHPEGVGPLQACKATIDGALKMRRWADNWLESSAVPGGVLSSEQELNTEEAQAAKRRFEQGASGRSVVVLGYGLSYKPVLLKPEEMQASETQDAYVLSIARMFGIPARLMLASMDGGSQTYSNLQQEDLSFLRWTLTTYLREIETALTWLLPRGNEAKFNLDAILRPDTLTRYQAHNIGIGAGFLTIDEVREIEDLQTKTGEPNE